MVKQDVTVRRKIETPTQKTHSSTFFFKERYKAANDRLQTAIAKYRK